jgi:hypothetical protein
MPAQGQYPIGNRTLAANDTVTGVVSGTTADIPLGLLQQFVFSNAASSGPTGSRPSPSFVGQGYFDTTLGFMVWVSQITPPTWVNAAGAQQ